MGFNFTAKCDDCGHQTDVRDLDVMKGWMRGHYAHGCTLTERERVIRECIAAVEAEFAVSIEPPWVGEVVSALRALLEGENRGA